MRHCKGMTLVEVLVVVALISMMLLLTGAAQRMVAQVMNRTGEHLAAFDDARILPVFLRSLVGSASNTALKLNGASEPAMYFFGDEHSLEWLGRLPVRYGAGGVNYLRIARCHDSSDGQSDICLFWLPLGKEHERPDWSRQQGHRLLSAPAVIRFAYFSAEESRWLASWHDNKQMPVALLLVLELSQGPLPVLVRMNASWASSQAALGDLLDWQQIGYQP